MKQLLFGLHLPVMGIYFDANSKSQSCKFIPLDKQVQRQYHQCSKGYGHGIYLDAITKVRAANLYR
jgi:hypothetical protein